MSPAPPISMRAYTSASTPMPAPSLSPTSKVLNKATTHLLPSNESATHNQSTSSEMLPSATRGTSSNIADSKNDEMTTIPMANAKSPSTPNSSTNPENSQSSTGMATSSSAIVTSSTHHHQHVSTLTNEEVLNLANACTWEEKVVWVARQLLGPGGSNGFLRATSAVQRLKRQRARQVHGTHKHKVSSGEGIGIAMSTAGEGRTDRKEDDVDEESLKLETFNVRVAKKMQSEMKQGLQFCNLMAEVIKSILLEIDPENPLLSVQPPIVQSASALKSSAISMPSSTMADMGGRLTEGVPVVPPSASSGAGVAQRFERKPSASFSCNDGANATESATKQSSTKVPISLNAARALLSQQSPNAETFAAGTSICVQHLAVPWTYCHLNVYAVK